ncbi:MAG: outer membrane protein assembly factor [Calditrichaceae bacterium]
MKSKIFIRLTFCFIFSFMLYSHLFAASEISKITFSHNKYFTAKELTEIINSKKKDTFEPRMIKLDKILLNNFYRKKGFLTVEVEDSLIYSKKKEKVELHYLINEGQRYYYGGVRFDGVSEIPEEKLINQFKNIPLLSQFDEGLINEAKQRVENVYYNSGKPFVKITNDYVFEQDSLVISLFTIQENQTVYIKDIQYTGTKLVQKFLIRRELEIKKGELYNREKMELSQQNIYGTGLFKYVRFEIEPIAAEPGSVNLKIYVQEKDPRWFGIHLGVANEQEDYYGSKLEFTVQGGHRNLFGTARNVSLHVTPSFLYETKDHKILNPENKISFMFVEPWIGYTRTPGIFQVSYHQYRPSNSGDFNLLKTSFGVMHKYPNKIELSGAIEAKFLDILSKSEIDTTILTGISQDQNQIYTVRLYGAKDTRKNIFNPVNSSLTDLSVSFSNSFGRDSNNNREINQYFTVISSWQRYQPIKVKIFDWRRNFTIATRLKVGGIVEIGKTEEIPISDRFYAGGANTVRGYPEQLLGPASTLDADGKIEEAAGGKMLYLSNAELRIPLFWLFVLENFIDAGYVWREIGDFRPADIKASIGAGLALMTPLGPVRLDYGYKLMRDEQDSASYSIHLGFYFAF